MNAATSLDAALDRVQKRALIAGAAGAILCVIGALVDHDAFLKSYLFAFVFWVGLGLGCLGFLMLHHMVGGDWGRVARRVLEAGAMSVLPMLVFFLPLLIDLRALYPWARADLVATDPILQHKQPYLNVGFFLARAGFAFGAWIFFAWIMSRWSRRDDLVAGAPNTRRLRVLAGPGIAVYVITATFMSVDWVMSLEPHWMSMIYGLIFIVGQVLSALCFIVVVLAFLSAHEPFKSTLTTAHFHDLGNFTFAFVMLWAYMSFSQFLIIWYGNLAEEVPWYAKRTAGGWQVVGFLLILLHFAVPFCLLLIRGMKRSAPALAELAAGLLVMRLVEQFWTIMPAFRRDGLAVHWLDFAAVLALGGFWVAFVTKRFRGAEALPRTVVPAIKEQHAHG